MSLKKIAVVLVTPVAAASVVHFGRYAGDGTAPKAMTQPVLLKVATALQRDMALSLKVVGRVESGPSAGRARALRSIGSRRYCQAFARACRRR
ncbi:MAG: hypothetical protein ABI767_02215 [Rhodanobacter sp.]